MPRALALALIVALALIAAACSDESPSSDGATTGAAADAYPVTIAHKFGTTEIAERPEQVVSLGLTEQDSILAVGVTPVAVRYAFGDDSDVIFPWAEEAAGDVAPTILDMPFGDLNIEAIAALAPDVIMAQTAGITAKEYELLAKIAPTVAQSGEYPDFGMPWQEMTLTAGRALGEEPRAAELVAGLEQRFADTRAQYPQLEGAGLVLSGPVYQGQYPFHASDDTRTRFFTELGLQVPERLDAIAGDQFFGAVSRERVELFDTDLLVFQAGSPAERAAISDDPLLQGLDVVREGRSLFVDGDLYDALQFSSVLSLPFLLDELPPRMAAALD